MKAAVSEIIPRSMRSTGFGIFEIGFGIAWFLGSWLLGALYDISPVWLVAVSVAVQLLAIVCYAPCIRQRAKERCLQSAEKLSLPPLQLHIRKSTFRHPGSVDVRKCF